MIDRIEKDALGEMKIPQNAYYGISTLRNKEMFSVTKVKVHKQMIKSLATVKKVCVLASFDAGAFSKELAKAICGACDEVINGRFNNQFLTDAIQGGAGSAMNMNMNEVIANRANEMLGGKLGTYEFVHPINHVNLFQSTNDVIPTSAKHAILHLAKSLLVELKKLKKCFMDKSEQFKDVYKLGQTHLQHSLPISFEELFKAMSSTTERDLQRITTALEEMKVINLGTGEVGVREYADNNYIKNLEKRWIEVCEMEFIKPANILDRARNLDCFVNLSHALKLCAINLSKTASDFNLLSSSSVNEITLPTMDICSSLVAGKKNPVILEVLNQVCFQVIGKDSTITLAAEHGQLDLNVFGPIIYPNLFDNIEYMTRSLKLFREYVVDGIMVNEDVCKDVIEKSPGIAVTLLPILGYEKTLDIINEARSKNLTVHEIVLRDKLIDPNKLKDILSVQSIKKIPKNK